MRNIKVAIVHDDLVQWGGAEKVLFEIANLFPDAPIYTSLFDKSNPLIYGKFKNSRIITSFLQKIPKWKTFYKLFLPLYGIAFEQFDFSEYDLVISQTTRFAKSVITKPETKHVCLMHTPPRFLWNFSGEKYLRLFNPLFNLLRVYDQVSSNRVDEYLAGSKNAQERIKKIYNRDSKVVLPFVDFEYFNKFENFKNDYYLIISRLNKYKKVDIAIKAFNKSGKKLIVVGKGPELQRLRQRSKGNIRFLNFVPDQLLLSLLLGCKGIIITAEEDFGLTSLEAQACGKGVIAYKKGGVLETVLEGKTAVLFNEQSREALVEAIEEFEKSDMKNEDCKKQAEKFSKEVFRKNFLEAVNNLN